MKEFPRGVLNLLIDHLGDTARIRTHSGCILDESKLIDLMIGLVTEYYYHPGYFVDYISQDSCYQLNEREIKWLKSIADRRKIQLEILANIK